MKVLVFAPHPDDEVLGCGGIIAKNISEGNKVYVCVVTKATAPLYSEKDLKTDRAECKKANEILGTTNIIFLDFPAAMLDSVPRRELNNEILNVVKKVNPDEVYIPHKGDMHIDHKIIIDACMVAMRPRGDNKVDRIYAYETVSETGWDVPSTENAFIPNVYVDITNYIDKKIKALKAYKSQVFKYPNARSLEAIKSLAIYRGTTVNKKYAESFMLIRDIK